MKILIIGATGFIGRELTLELSGRKHRVRIVSRNPVKAAQIFGDSVEIRQWDGNSLNSLSESLEGMDGVVNLAGESIAGGLWTRERKRILTSSRVVTGRNLADAILQQTDKPAFLIQGSATGFYGPVIHGAADEKAAMGSGFLADLARRWESSVSVLQDAGIRLAFLRTGVVLGRDAGMLMKLLKPFRFYAGIIPGNGNQYISWIHLTDVVRAVCHLIENDEAAGPYNLTSPSPATMKTLINTISDITGKPAFLRIPAILLQAGLGQMARETILSSQEIYPAKLLQEGFRFRFPDLSAALNDLLQDKK